MNITEVSVLVNGTRSVLANATDETYCNHLVPDNREQTVFSVVVARDVDVVLEAVVDQDMALSQNETLVQPEGYVDDA